MRNIVRFIFILLFSLTTTVLAEPEANTPDSSAPQPAAVPTPTLDAATSPQAPVIIPNPPNIDAKGYVLMDANTGQVLASLDMHEHLQPASLTKLMTVFVASKALRQGQIHLADSVRISTKAWKMEGSRMFLRVGTTVDLQQLLRGIIIASGNDACVALAEHIAGSEDSFANLMNQTAAQLGMKDTHFVDSTGMPNPDHYASPYDLAILSRAIINDFPEDYQWYKEKWITYNGIRQPNRNRLLWRDPTVDGLKTGHTNDAGFCLIASAKRNNMRLISVVMGAPSDEARADDTQALLDWGFRFFENHQLFDAQKPLTSLRVWMGQEPNVSLGLTQPLSLTIPVGQYKNLKATMQLDSDLKAPVVKGQTLGHVQVKLQDKVIATAPLVALTDDPVGGFFTRLSDHIKLFINKKL